LKTILLPLLIVATLLVTSCRAPMSGRLVSEHGKSGDDHRTIEYRVYLPPGYAKEPQKKYPLLVWFHGGGENENGWGRVGRIGEIVDDRTRKGELQEFIVLAPSAGSFTPLWFGYESRLIKETIPAIEQQYRTNGVVVAFGHSMGGLSLLMVGLRNPQAFDALCVASPFVYDTSAWESPERRAWFEKEFPNTRFASNYRQNQRKYFDTPQDFAKWDPYSMIRTGAAELQLPPLLLTCGDKDNLGLWPHTLHLHNVMTESGITHEWLPQAEVGHGTVETPALMDWLNKQATSAEASK